MTLLLIQVGQDRDFDPSNNASNLDVVKFGTDITTDFEYYLPRIDKIFLDKEGAFKVAKGASSLDPQVPKIFRWCNAPIHIRYSCLYFIN